MRTVGAKSYTNKYELISVNDSKDIEVKQFPTRKAIAEHLGISIRTLNRRMNKHNGHKGMYVRTLEK